MSSSYPFAATAICLVMLFLMIMTFFTINSGFSSIAGAAVYERGNLNYGLGVSDVRPSSDKCGTGLDDNSSSCPLEIKK